MADQCVKLFLSCVSDEFGVCRDALRRALTRPNVEVKIQEDFKSLGGDTLRMLEEYIEHCQAVVHFVGEMTGSAPKAHSVRELLKRHPDLKTRLPPIGEALDAGKPISYTQWEAWLALVHGKDLEVVTAAPRVRRSRKFKATEASRAAQGRHVAGLRSIGIHPNPPFTSKDNLVAQIINTSVIKALVKAAAAPARQPRNLPFASLGPLFMGRDKALGELRAKLAAGKGAAVVGRALHGLGGVGKTRLAIEYALRHEADYSALLFLRADDPATLNANLSALANAEALDLPEKEEREDPPKIEAALRWLAGHPTWLMILDNVDDEKAVAAMTRLMARLRGGHVVVTARATNFPASLRKLELGVLDDKAAAEFLLERTRDDRAAGEDDAESARELAGELGGLALGLEQAGAYISTEHIGFARYLALWRESRQKVVDWFDRELLAYDHDAGLAATWTTSVARLSPESRRLLDRIAMVAPDPIPNSLLDVAVPGEAGDHDAHKARAGLYAYSLIATARSEDGLAKGFGIHRLMQDFARRAMTDERRGEALWEALIWIDRAFAGNPLDVRSWPVLDPLAPHALAVARRADEAGIAEPTAQLFGQLGLLLHAKARFAEAEPLLRRALAIIEASYAWDSPTMAIALMRLVELLCATNRHSEAEPLLRRYEAIGKAIHGPDYEFFRIVRVNPESHPRAGEPPGRTEAVLRRAVAIGEASFGPDHPKVAERLCILSLLLHGMERPSEAEPLIRRSLAIVEASYGPNHPEVANSLNNLAGFLQETHRFDEAEQLFRRALKIIEKSLGDDHPQVSIELNLLANLLEDTNRHDEAESLLRRAQAIDEASYGPDLAALEAERNRRT